MIYLKYTIILLFTFGILLDYLSIFYKTINNNKIIGKLLSSASLIQFYSRIFYLTAVFAIVFSKEQFNLDLNIFEIIIVSISISLIIIIFALKKINFFNKIYFIPIFIIEKVHNYKFNVSNKVIYEIKIDRILILGVIINSLIFFALMLPFIIIKFFPNLVMSSVYSSQVLNFISNFILLTFYDPRVNNLIDIGDASLRGQMIISKLISYIVLLIFLIIS